MIVADGTLSRSTATSTTTSDWLFKTKLANREAQANAQKDASGEALETILA
jgi:hypothetical protein